MHAYTIRFCFCFHFYFFYMHLIACVFKIKFTRSNSYIVDMHVPDIECNNADLDATSSKSGKGFRSTLHAGFNRTYREYCEHCSVHGLQYLGEQQRPLREHLFWLSVFVVSLYCCTWHIHTVYTKWNDTPVIVSFAEKSTPVWNIPFPAVTICSQTKYAGNGSTYAELFNNFIFARGMQTFKAENISSREMEKFRTLLHVCNTQRIEEDMPTVSGDDIDYFDVLDRMLPPFESYFFYCQWLSRFNECDQFFHKTLTEEGICFTFNGLLPTDIYREDTYQYQNSAQRTTYMAVKQNTGDIYRPWSLEAGYAPNSEVETYPARVLSAGTRSSMHIALQNFRQELDYACRSPLQGFKVLLHAPDDVPQVSRQFVRVPMGKEVLIAVKPNMITTSSGIAEYHPLRRQCFLSHERKLRFFKVYTESNCQLECLANFTLSKCGCVKFSMPRSLDMPVCAENKIYCYDHAEMELLVREFKRVRSLSIGGESQTVGGKESACNCMPACTSLVYNTEISQGNFEPDEMLLADGDTEFLREYPDSQMSRLSIYFKENQFITSKRSELYGATEFLANCGGIFGLFMGFSILSMVEIIYHFTLRFWFNMKQLLKVHK